MWPSAILQLQLCLSIVVILATHSVTMELINGRMFEGKKWLFLIFTVDTYSTVNNFLFSSLHICILLADKSQCDAKRPKVVVITQRTHTQTDTRTYRHPHVCAHAEMSKSFLSTSLLKASTAGTAKTHCATTVIWEMREEGGRREACAGMDRLVQTDTLHTHGACQTNSVPSSNQMLPCDSFAQQEQPCTEAVCYGAERLGCLHSNGSAVCV